MNEHDWKRLTRYSHPEFNKEVLFFKLGVKSFVGRFDTTLRVYTQDGLESYSPDDGIFFWCEIVDPKPPDLFQEWWNSVPARAKAVGEDAAIDLARMAWDAAIEQLKKL